MILAPDLILKMSPKKNHRLPNMHWLPKLHQPLDFFYRQNSPIIINVDSLQVLYKDSLQSNKPVLKKINKLNSRNEGKSLNTLDIFNTIY